MAFKLHMNFGPMWESVSIIRNFTTDMLSTGILDTNDAKKVATACSELIENVVKYSAAGGVAIDIKKDLGNGEIYLTIQNIANEEDLETFESVFQTVTSGDPKEVYKNMMLRSFSDPETSQLGLARIRYECQGELSYSISDNTNTIAQLQHSDSLQDDFKVLSVSVKIPVQ